LLLLLAWKFPETFVESILYYLIRNIVELIDEVEQVDCTGLFVGLGSGAQFSVPF
jgi:hypothetical protein